MLFLFDDYLTERNFSPDKSLCNGYVTERFGNYYK